MTIAELIPGATETLPRRILAKVVKLDCGCWGWTGATSRKRDGAKRPKIQVGGVGSRVVVVARLALVLKDGVSLLARDYAKLEAGHTCHNYWCVNPDHLEWQTRVENERAKRDRDSYSEFSAAVDDLAAEGNDNVAPDPEGDRAPLGSGYAGRPELVASA